jgi:hypothetical protein
MASSNILSPPMNLNEARAMKRVLDATKKLSKDEAFNLILDLSRSSIAVYEFVNGRYRRGKIEPKLKRERKAAKTILKYLTDEPITDQEIENWLS